MNELNGLEWIDGKLFSRALRATVDEETYEILASWVMRVSVHGTYRTIQPLHRGEKYTVQHSYPLDWLLNLLRMYEPDDDFQFDVDGVSHAGQNETVLCEWLYRDLYEDEVESFIRFLDFVVHIMEPFLAPIGLRLTVSWLANVLMFAEPAPAKEATV